ncbi:hypothetical protein JIM95_008705 [Corynebacterium sp. CCM 8835]|uniref:Uncharacterized protein n=2 Tax=Corynebacterium antarcticum TaxID=2800405 RepID=A0ABS1FLR1_9CORY|nr:hypothetical protein [Corynebacterium antarcticum]MCK7661470.1 hypothetical protein [Corynebacterium antarcticum]MCL0246212.1 hypothetical protein [Corynebacterium antarcticum]MCX7492463.1 hypothetical protein [Corynebacterium antarcticum]MCX7540804.1 hypothetical protein [Corynebacterium antarcticum]
MMKWKTTAIGAVRAPVPKKLNGSRSGSFDELGVSPSVGSGVCVAVDDVVSVGSGVPVGSSCTGAT